MWLLPFLTPLSSSYRMGYVPPMNTDDVDIMYQKISDIWFMTFLVPFLMGFIKKFEWHVNVASLLVCASSWIFWVILEVWGLDHYWDDYEGAGLWSATIQGNAIVCAITAIVAIGWFIGEIQLWQYIPAGALFALSQFLAYYINNSGKVIENLVDPGGATLVHMFAAYWGMGVAVAIRDKRAFNEPMYCSTHSVQFAWLSSLLLFILWPSFITLFFKGALAIEGMNVCYAAGVGSILSAFIVDLLLEKKLNPLVYAYALLGGPVAISTGMFVYGVWGGLLCGAIGGVISVLAFVFLHGPLTRALGVMDVMGVHNLHGVCSWTSTISGMFGLLAIGVNGKEAAKPFYCSFITLGVSFITGVVTGTILRFTRYPKLPDGEQFDDHYYFIFNSKPDSDEDSENGQELSSASHHSSSKSGSKQRASSHSSQHEA